MAIEHVNIADVNRHETKGASTATAGQVHHAVGSGVTNWVNPSTLRNITVSSTLEGQDTVTQGPSAVDTAYQVTFGAGGSNSDASIASNGVVTITTAGLYLVTFELNFGRSTTTTSAIMAVRLLINDVATGFVNVVKITGATDIVPFNTAILRSFSASDTIKVQILRDSTGENDGSLVAFNPALTGWADSPSAAIRLQKIAGGY